MEDDSKYHRMKWKKKNGFKEIFEVDVNGWTKLVAEKPLQKRIIAACGNDCSACPRYVAHPFEK